MPLLEFTDAGIYCRQADAYIDPWRPVERAIITHAHSDHSKYGMKSYLAHPISAPVMRLRLGEDINLQTMEFGQSVTMNGVRISFHPAGHIPGSAQVRAEYKGEVWVVSGDYKLEDDGISDVWEPVPCQHFITESTFGLPVYTWQPQAEIFADINAWWARNAAAGICTIITGYSLGKAQRILRNIDTDIGPVFVHGAIANTNAALEGFFPFLSQFRRVVGQEKKSDYRRALIVAPPSALGSAWVRKFMPFSAGVCSGWMALRGARRRRAVDRGFILSDHCDWPSLNSAIRQTGAEHVYVTHGYTAAYARYINDQIPNVSAAEVHTLYGVEAEEEETPPLPVE